MTSSEFISQFNTWPEDIKKKVLAYVEQLLTKNAEPQKQEQKKVRQPGCGKGIFTNIPDAEEFNKPLEDFKDYM